jgi:hypothetical protein
MNQRRHLVYEWQIRLKHRHAHKKTGRRIAGSR